MFCSQCGAKIVDNAKFCQKCGCVIAEAITSEAAPVMQNTPYTPTQQNAPVPQYVPLQPARPNTPGQQNAPVLPNAPAQQFQSFGTTFAGKFLNISVVIITAVIYILMLTPLFSITILTSKIDVTVFNSFGLLEKAMSIVKSFGWLAGDEATATALGFLGIFAVLAVILIVAEIYGTFTLVIGFIKILCSGDLFIPVNRGIINGSVFLLAFLPLFIDTGEYAFFISVKSSPTMITAAVLCVVCFILEIIGNIYNSKHGYEKTSIFGKKKRGMVPANAAAVPMPTDRSGSVSAPVAGVSLSKPAEPQPIPVQSAAIPAPAAPAPTPTVAPEPPQTEWICELCGTRNRLISDTCKRCEHKREK